ncbi:TolC family protein, partial [Vibrio vulnificus]|uniref:TolC family protein n=1 Tax=Vibrio vulnificus TaxID=672 RepID=UPI0005086B1C
YLKSELDLPQAHNELAQKLLAAYSELATAQADLLLAQTKLIEGNTLLQIIAKRYQACKGKSVDEEEMRATQVSEQATILNAQADLEVKRAEQAPLINQVPESVDQISTDTLIQPPMQGSYKEKWLKLAKDS